MIPYSYDAVSTGTMMPVLDAVISNNLQEQTIFLSVCGIKKTLYDMHIFNCLYLKQLVNTDDLKFNTCDTM